MFLSNLPCRFARFGAFFRAGRAVSANLENSDFHLYRSHCAKEQLLQLHRSHSPETEVFRRAASTTAFGNGLIFRQMFDKESWTYTYLLADAETKEAVIVDPVYEQAERDIKMIEQNGLKLLYAVNTHVHADHITGSGVLKRRLPSVSSAISLVSGGKADLYLEHGSCLKFGHHSLQARSTPGHTNGCMSFFSTNRWRRLYWRRSSYSRLRKDGFPGRGCRHLVRECLEGNSKPSRLDVTLSCPRLHRSFGY